MENRTSTKYVCISEYSVKRLVERISRVCKVIMAWLHDSFASGKLFRNIAIIAKFDDFSAPQLVPGTTLQEAPRAPIALYPAVSQDSRIAAVS
jgi:hypothetical protein